MKSIGRKAVVAAFTFGILATVGCSSGKSGEDQSAEASPPAVGLEQPENSGSTDGEGAQQGPGITVDFECGQLSLLTMYQLRLDQALSNRSSGEAGRQAQKEMLRDLWATAANGNTPVSKQIRAVQKAVETGNTLDYDEAVSSASRACTANGSGVVMSFLPGEGG